MDNQKTINQTIKAHHDSSDEGETTGRETIVNRSIMEEDNNKRLKDKYPTLHISRMAQITKPKGLRHTQTTYLAQIRTDRQHEARYRHL
jgi:hypothetical protein